MANLIKSKIDVVRQGMSVIILPEELPELRYPLSDSWRNAAGLLRHRRAELEEHLARVRSEWGAGIAREDLQGQASVEL